MSAFLGPIHYWLYNKIQIQNAITKNIFALGNQYGLSLEKDCEDNFGPSETKPLEEIIDEGNIHGWLQERVSQAEYKYAFAVTRILEKDPSALEQLKTLLLKQGEELGKTLAVGDLNASDLFKVITDTLLDGMPCDHANSLIESNEAEVVWKRNLCVHKSYWDYVGGDISVYYELRDSWMEGLGKELGYIFSKIDSNTYRISKGA